MSQMNTPTQGHHVTAVELVRNFAHWRDTGAREPVVVTHHGRETHMLLGIDQYRDLARAGRAEAVGADADRLRDLAAFLHEGLILCAADFTVRLANTAALAMTRCADRAIEGVPLWQAVPGLAGTLIETHLRRCLASGARSAADMPSPFRPDQWLQVECFVLADEIGLLLRDIDPDVRQNRMADEQAATVHAIDVQGHVAHARLSMRGFLEAVNPGFCAIVGLPEARLAEVPLPDLVDIADRPGLRAQLEAVLRGDGDRRLRIRFLNNMGACVPVDMALVRLEGLYGGEGAIAVLTRADADI